MMHKREGNYILIDNEAGGFVWVHNDTEENVSPIFEESDEAEFWMFTDGQKKLFPKASED